ncbi:hypothetical protein ACF1DV_26055 [Streptomyces achromogenes]|uniref:hypothetical protein n=1 Tax=Streptomyces achromogenes TaxID=67255 RepID=UPI0036FF2DB0
MRHTPSNIARAAKSAAPLTTQGLIFGTYFVPFTVLALTVGLDTTTDAVVTFGAPIVLWMLVVGIHLARTK